MLGSRSEAAAGRLGTLDRTPFVLQAGPAHSMAAVEVTAGTMSGGCFICYT